MRQRTPLRVDRPRDRLRLAVDFATTRLRSASRVGARSRSAFASLARSSSTISEGASSSVGRGVPCRPRPVPGRVRGRLSPPSPARWPLGRSRRRLLRDDDRSGSRSHTRSRSGSRSSFRSRSHARSARARAPAPARASARAPTPARARAPAWAPAWASARAWDWFPSGLRLALWLRLVLWLPLVSARRSARVPPTPPPARAAPRSGGSRRATPRSAGAASGPTRSRAGRRRRGGWRGRGGRRPSGGGDRGRRGP